MWIEEHVLDIDPAAWRACARRRRRAATLLRLLRVARADLERGVQNLLEIELFEGVVWVQDVIDYVGPTRGR